MAKRISQVTVTYDLDDVLERHYPTINGKLDKAANHLKNEKPVREWYEETYPLDDMGEEIKPDLKWDELFEKLRNRVNIYAAIGVDDSIVRERIEDHLCLLLMIPYEALRAIKILSWDD